MPPLIPTTPSLIVANAQYFGAFAPDPATGTIFGPLLSDPSTVASVPISDGPISADLEISSLLVMEEVGAYGRFLQGQGQRLPAPLPSGSCVSPHPSKETWSLRSCIAGHEGNLQGIIKAFSSARREVEIDLRNPKMSRYTVGAGSEAAELSQTISVDLMDHSVLTDRYYSRIRSIPFSGAVKLALALSALIYTSGFYDAPEDLGSFQFRRGEMGAWIGVPFEGGQFLVETSPEDEKVELSFASSRSVMESGDFREPVFSIDLPRPNTQGTRDVEILLYRPSEATKKLIPLPGKIRRGLWQPVMQRIQTGR